MTFLLNEFINYLIEQVRNHSIYAWGAQGQMGMQITEAWIRKMEKGTGGYKDGRSYADAAVTFWKKQVSAGYGSVLRAFDCSGLGMYFLQNLMGLVKGDMSANSMLGKCTKLARAQLKRGDWVFRVYTSGSSKGRAYHIGYVVDDALNVIEAKGRDDGVVKRALNAGGSSYWNQYGRPSYFKAEIEGAAPTPAPPTKRLLKLTDPRMAGDDVTALQMRLKEFGFGKHLGTSGPGRDGVDGSFGPMTRDAVIAYQRAQGLDDDGKVGPLTYATLSI